MRTGAAGPWSRAPARGGQPDAPPPPSSTRNDRAAASAGAAPIRTATGIAARHGAACRPPTARTTTRGVSQPAGRNRRSAGPRGGAPAATPAARGHPHPESAALPPESGCGAPSPPPESYADRIRVDDLVPARKVPPGRGWRLALYKVTFGLVSLGPSADEVRQAELEARIKSGLRGHYKVGVMGKGGVGKTTVSASVGSVFAELRQEDRVVAIDADTAFGKLGSRVDPKAQGSYWELASDQHLETFADVRSRVGNNAAGLFVLAGEATPARRRVLDPAIYREATSRLDRHFTISIIDCSSTMDTPVTQRCCESSTR